MHLYSFLLLLLEIDLFPTREAFNELLAENHWMDEETRDVARDKANAMNERIGYPDYILNDTALTGRTKH